MKTILIYSLIFSLQLIAHSQTVQKSSNISPEDFGAHKWTLSGTASKNEVLFFRVTTIKEIKDNSYKEVYDSVHYHPGKEIQMSAFFYDPNYFDMARTKEPEWFWKVFGRTGWIAGKWASSESREDLASISFESNKWGKTTKRFEVFVLPYEKAKKIHEDLPEIKSNNAWVWGGFVPKSEPVDVDDPGNPSKNSKKQLDD